MVSQKYTCWSETSAKKRLSRELDAHIPMSDVETIKSKQPSLEVYTYNADHGFQCDERDSFAAEAAQIAWGRTLRFIDSRM